MERLSGRERMIMEFVIDFITNNGYSPSFDEIGEAVGLKSKSTISWHLAKLREKGYINYFDYMTRTISVTGYKYVKEEHNDKQI